MRTRTIIRVIILIAIILAIVASTGIDYAHLNDAKTIARIAKEHLSPGEKTYTWQPAGYAVTYAQNGQETLKIRAEGVYFEVYVPNEELITFSIIDRTAHESSPYYFHLKEECYEEIAKTILENTAKKGGRR